MVWINAELALGGDRRTAADLADVRAPKRPHPHRRAQAAPARGRDGDRGEREPRRHQARAGLRLESTLEKAFGSQNGASLREGVGAKRLAAGLERKVDVLTAVATALVLLFGARQVRAGGLTPGQLVVFMLYLKAAFKPMRDVAKYTGRIAQASASAERIVELLDEQPEIVDAPHAVDAPTLPRRPVLRARDVRLRAGTARAARRVAARAAGCHGRARGSLGRRQVERARTRAPPL